jgi:glycosyltransferase involved in cell wall biosynthesis
VGEGKERPHLEAKAKQFELGNLQFVGSRTKAEMRAVLAGSNACLATLKNIPMFRTTYPNKVFDYMAAGRPTILAIDGVIRQVVDAAGGGIFVEPGNDRALAAAVQTLCDDRERCRAMGMAARRYVVENFNRHRQAEDFVRLLERLANGSPTENEPPVPEARETCV